MSHHLPTEQRFLDQSRMYMDAVRAANLPYGPIRTQDVMWVADGLYQEQDPDAVKFLIEQWPDQAAAFARMTVIAAGLVATGELPIQERDDEGPFAVLAAIVGSVSLHLHPPEKDSSV